MRKKHPSDVSQAQFEQISLLLEGVRKNTKPRKIELYEVFCAVLYVLTNSRRFQAKVVVNGAGCPVIFQNGERRIPVFPSGMSLPRTALAYWSRL